MSRSSAKGSAPSGESRLRRFVEIEKTHGAEGSHPAARALHERAANRDDGAKVREYARIERGREA